MRFRVNSRGIVILIETIEMDTENRDRNEAREPEATSLLRYIRGEASEEEKARVDAWLALDGENEKTLSRIARIYYANRVMERVAGRDVFATYAKMERRMAKRVYMRWMRRASWVAACVAILVGFSVAWFKEAPESKKEIPQFVTFRANAGIRTDFNLPDGTSVYLNSGSVLSYPLAYDGKTRNVSLSGEAYFKVARDEERPFIVSIAGDRYKVKVLGTEFNVQAYEDEEVISTTLVEGSVDIEVSNGDGTTDNRRLLPSEKMICDLDEGKVSVTKANPMYETAWMEGKLMFKDTPLPEALRRMSHYYNVTFSVEDPEINDYRLTGTLDNRLLSQTLDYLRISSNIDYRMEEVRTDDSDGSHRTHVILRKGK